MRHTLSLLVALVLVAASLLSAGFVAAAAPPAPQPVTLPCAENVTAQPLGRHAAMDAAGQDVVLVRIIFGPGGSIGPHTHPGMLVVSVESGTLGFTLLEEGTMAVTRAAPAGTPAAEEPLTAGQEVLLGPGDGFAEMGMVHTARSVGDEPAVILVSGLIETGQPLTRCVDDTSGA